VHNRQLLSLKQLYGLAYQWIMAKEAEGVMDEDSIELANAVIDFLRFVRKVMPHRKNTPQIPASPEAHAGQGF
jgi:hypothetical protein